ncbi:macro domain-containing protein [Beijerinckia sp. L45]|uniref:type II toxin-antitoxin system antitoxin DNA ADP-ribosyl glycohydrolase DarG n=1 Tax=Beijerinckia sp. L45 TaxID=1641855 RepID=UPI00131C1239|nr:macro domain-containing protein [Beijerinckia sp. L45]
MITFTTGNLLSSEAEALVNTVNTVGVMGKGIALMFKEAFPDNFRAYEEACKSKLIEVGTLFVTERQALVGPRWIINFPTKKHWRNPSKIEWIEQGLCALKAFIAQQNIGSIAVPPLGSGNGGLDWAEVKPIIERILGSVDTTVSITIYEPTSKYQNVSKRVGVEKLTPSRALIAELVRRYWILGIECSLLEIQKLAYFLEHTIASVGAKNELDLRFTPNRYGPYAHRLTHLLNGLDGSYLHCDKRLADAGPLDVIWFDDVQRDKVATYLASEAKPYLPALEATAKIIDGFESPLGLELLATVHWLLNSEGIEPSVGSVRAALSEWPGGAGERKLRLFDDRLIELGINRLLESAPKSNSASV